MSFGVAATGGGFTAAWFLFNGGSDLVRAGGGGLVDQTTPSSVRDFAVTLGAGRTAKLATLDEESAVGEDAGAKNAGSEAPITLACAAPNPRRVQ